MRPLVVAALLASIGSGAAAAEAPVVVETDDLLHGKLDPGFERDDLPRRVLDLDGRRVSIRGFLYPVPKERVSRFVLAGETAGKPACLANAGPESAHHLILIQLAPGRELATEPFLPFEQLMAIEGRFVIDVRKSDEKVRLRYRIDDATVRPVEPRDGYRSALDFGC